MKCNICYKEVNQRTILDGKWLCNSCLGANYPGILSKSNQEIKQLKDKLHRRNMQIKDLKTQLDYKYETEMTPQYNKETKNWE